VYTFLNIKEKVDEMKNEFPNIDEILIDEDGCLEIFYPTWFKRLLDSYIENLTNEEEYYIAKDAYDNGLKIRWILEKDSI